jgi:hypothetical protein
MIGSPSNLELLLHCHYSPEQHPRLRAPAIQEGIDYLIGHGMIRHARGGDPEIYDTTEKGVAYIDYLMQVPFPEQHWIVPGEKING